MAQSQRIECKYLIPLAVAEQIRLQLSRHLELDPYCRTSPDASYLISSLYLDNERLDLFRGTEEGQMNRYKLRVRVYDDEPETPAFCEIKQRVDGIVKKQRALVRKCSCKRIVNGLGPRVDDLWRDRAGEYKDLLDFSSRMARLQAGPMCLVRYRRQAWVVPGSESLRITFDWNLETCPAMAFDLRVGGPGWERAAMGIDHEVVILEIKYTDTYPGWVQELVRNFHLQRTSVPKYILSAESLGVAQRLKGHARRLIV